MKKYRIILGGRGAECFLHNLTEEKKEMLIEIDIEDNEQKVDNETINEILDVDYWDIADHTIMGVYNDSQNIYISVVDENEKVVWESGVGFKFMVPDDFDWDYRDYYKPNQLMIEHQIKGNFYEYEIELKDDFNPEKITPIFSEVNEVVDLVIGLKYDGKELEVADWGSNDSKGVFFYLT